MNGEIQPRDAQATETRSGFTPNLVVGIGVTLLGVVLMLDKLELTDAFAWLRYWPVLLTLFGLSIAYQALQGDRGDKSPPILSAPLVLLLIFLGVLASRVSERTGQAAGVDRSDTVSVHALMSGNRHVVTADQFRRGEVTTVMGESRLDLRQTTILPGEEAVVDIVTVMGSTIVYVPAGWDVNFDAVPVMGGVKDERNRPGAAAALNDNDDDDGDDDEDGRNRRSREEAAPAPAAPPVAEPPAPAGGPQPRLVLRGFIMMGGLVIRS
jgi:hypothetical protein